jgi:hypothetical protein
MIHYDRDTAMAFDKARRLGTALVSASFEQHFEQILNPTRLEETAPAHKRIADTLVHKLDSCGKFQQRRLIVSNGGELFICASKRGVTKEGAFTKRAKNHFGVPREGWRASYLMPYKECFFVLADGTLKYWRSKGSDFRQSVSLISLYVKLLVKLTFEIF